MKKMVKYAISLMTIVALLGFGMSAAQSSTLAPVVVTSAATSISSTSAVFNATANPQGQGTTVWFQWIPADGDANTVSYVGSDLTVHTVSVTISGLTPSTTYTYQVVAWNAGGLIYGNLVPFTTLAAGSPPPPKTIYLTFDDGPTAGYTDEVLADLRAAGAHATFFQLGQSTYSVSGMCPAPMSYNKCLTSAKNAGLVRQALADGNEIGTHSWTHPDFTTISKSKTATEISQARSLQVAITGHDSKLFRYPFFRNSTAGDQYLASQGMMAEGATVDPSDWDSTVTDAQVVASVMAQAFDGAVVDLHDGQEGTDRDGEHPGYLPALLTQLKAAGYGFGLLSIRP